MITLCDVKRHNPDYYTEIVLCVDGVEWKKRSERERESSTIGARFSFGLLGWWCDAWNN